jgi:serine phosphatase RsbU (regulator of sigma subunit)
VRLLPVSDPIREARLNRLIRWGLITSAVLVTIIDIFGYTSFHDSPYTGIQHRNFVFYEFEPESPNIGLPLAIGDRIEAVDGTAVRNMNQFRYLTESSTPGEVQTYTISREDSTFEVTVRSIPQPASRIYRRTSVSLTAFTFIILSLIVILRRPDILGYLFTVNCFIIAFLFTIRPVTPIRFLHLAGELVYDSLIVFFPAFFLHFFLIFPGKEIVEGTPRSRVKKVIYIPPTLLFFALFFLALIRYSSGVERDVVLILNMATSIYWIVYIVACVAFFIRTYLTSDRIQRVKFRIATLGVVLGVVPISSVMAVRNFLPDINIPHPHLSVLFLSFISASFAYAILKHDAFDLRFVFRAGLVFVIVPGVLAAIVLVLGGLMGERLARFLDVKTYFLVFFVVTIFIAAFIPVRTGLQKFADRILFKSRKFFRDKLIEFSRNIQSFNSMDRMVDYVTSTLFELFDPEYVHLYLGGSGKNYTLAGSKPEGSELFLTSLPSGTDLIRLAGEKRFPLMVECYDRIWINNNLDRTSREIILSSRASVIVPLVEKGVLLGFTVLGRKRNGKAYGGSDAEILELLGERSAAAIRNNLLYRDSVEKEKLEKEVHLASEIQQRLLPSSHPDLARSEIVGEIMTSREMGGDFYDYVEFKPGLIGFAVADVSGKGIPASILMTTLQASFRAEATEEKSPAAVLSALNRSLFDRSDTGRFATFFYAIYEDESGILRFCNGGAYPPLVITSDGSITRLQRGGPLIGVDPDSTFSDGVLKLKPRDLLVAYTDGFIDQENSSEEYFGEERLIAFFRAHHALELEKLTEKLFDAVLAFGDGTLKDDMTSIMLRFNGPAGRA